MKFAVSLKILFKSQITSALIFAALYFIPVVLSGDIVAAAGMALVVIFFFFLYSALIYYTIGLIVHRLFLKYELYDIKHTIIMTLVFVLLMTFFGKGNIVYILFNMFVIVFPQLLLIRHFTLKELRKI